MFLNHSPSKNSNMQDSGCISPIAGLEDPTISQPIADDTDWLEDITLDESDYDLPSPQFTLKLNNLVDLPDEDAALIAHLRDRQQASDLDEYEWHSDDLVSEVYSDDDDDASDEELPRLARKDMFERGIQREYTWSREYREQRDEPHIFYMQKIQERLGFMDDEGSYVSDEGWSAQAGDKHWGTPETSSGGEWTTRSAAEDGWTEWKAEDREPWTRPESPLIRDEDGMDQEQGSAEMDKNSGELCLRRQTPDWESVPGNSAHKEQSSARIQPHLTPFRDATTIANLNDISSLPSPTTRINSKRPKLTSQFCDPEPVKLEPIHDTNPTLDEQVLNTFLDTCIEKTQSLLAVAEQALASTPKIGEISDLDEKPSGGKEEGRKYNNSHSNEDMATKLALERDIQTQDLLTLIDTTPAEIVRVEGWYKVKGGEAWREVGTWVEDECAALCEFGYLR